MNIKPFESTIKTVFEFRLLQNSTVSAALFVG